MTERNTGSSDDVASVLQAAIDRVHERVRLEAMWDPSLADPEIHLADEELDEFLSSFAQDDKGLQLQRWIEGGAQCESTKEVKGIKIKCVNTAEGSVDWNGVTISDSILTCRQDLRSVYRSVMVDGVSRQGISPIVTINGKEIPKPGK